MNISELARRLNVLPEDLRAKLPELGFSIGTHAIKVDDRVAGQIQSAWAELKRRQRLQEKMESQKAEQERREKRVDEEQKPITLPSVITVRDFASCLQLPVPRVMQELMRSGIFASLNERLDFDTASIIAEDLGFKANLEEKKAGEEINHEADKRLSEVISQEKEETLRARPPVVVVMGHVDHGKTKILDAIRKTNVMESEAGGITQHIGAYQVERKGRLLTFIDTPGHEAFTVMRSRGAKVADIAILVVAADDGVQPQTKEAVNIIQSSHLPFVVALNKIDKADANQERVKGQLAELNLIPEDWGGKTVIAPVSAKAGTGIDGLLDVLILTAELNDKIIRANPNRPAIGTVIESHVDPGEGPAATVLVQAGTLKLGDGLGVVDTFFGRVRAMRDWRGESIQEAPPSMPVKIVGLKYAPAVGDVIEVPVDTMALKKLKVKPMRAVEEVASIKHTTPVEGEEGSRQTRKVILRADVLGSLEAILGMFDTVQHPEVGIEVVGKGLGHINESDILNAEATGAVVIGFNARPTTTAEELAREKEVEIREYSIIYKLFEDLLVDLQKLLPSETVITEIGKAEVLANFKKLDNGWVVGLRVKDGKVKPKAKIRIWRGEEIVGEGEILTVQIGRSEAKDAKAGQECGVGYKSKTKAELGDIFEFYTEETKGRLLEIKGIRAR
ncbi:MAG: Translation initiation factor IF-2 [Candidatus Uhrbacteria bacterium GW2011_GWE2_45_35]|uniref:Translation initiation factor IF-2 n=2 Tax=Candidatus Uhriibacteriota TaxID=1752732 RepID=A0A0G1JAQ7_9BACT|nr:MAG: Translation initiation factor IF-2 [Candidatus Uhrbacteria bacterium GW2011_GWF2_44_350]KKU08375.1 MAG: Translation initiation factor IF-2 [Candidatus Uhrbacteria bacterium GW2011_GWE2_45_35]HBR80533.1 translation initiation factor IF-2 [Candidatus Uhrbacteria bacterium]HCU31298.1 translation initiation factor IF-2 [Candidatus Uhrbacteria bacterium]